MNPAAGCLKSRFRNLGNLHPGRLIRTKLGVRSLPSLHLVKHSKGQIPSSPHTTHATPATYLREAHHPEFADYFPFSNRIQICHRIHSDYELFSSVTSYDHPIRCLYQKGGNEIALPTGKRN